MKDKFRIVHVANSLTFNPTSPFGAKYELVAMVQALIREEEKLVGNGHRLRWSETPDWWLLRFVLFGALLPDGWS